MAEKSQEAIIIIYEEIVAWLIGFGYQFFPIKILEDTLLVCRPYQVYFISGDRSNIYSLFKTTTLFL